MDSLAEARAMEPTRTQPSTELPMRRGHGRRGRDERVTKEQHMCGGLVTNVHASVYVSFLLNNKVDEGKPPPVVRYTKSNNPERSPHRRTEAHGQSGRCTVTTKRKTRTHTHMHTHTRNKQHNTFLHFTLHSVMKDIILLFTATISLT
uniref:Uncharacterized protein n=1 Tax=Trypanosoma congolense (strain IL3000) TaxID=1068625 RepID=F9WK43_TRYCI|nr:hypothetical protein, unlikely [Trypanosoma congolense IL3000]